MEQAIIPIPRCDVSIRPAVEGDYAFVDRLQHMHSKALGFMRKAALEGKIKLGEVLIAEDENRIPIGYCILSNRYLKRDELGVIYQMNVLPGKQRHLVGATLLKEVFERAPYGCKLYCCWCAQDLNANYFWESLGFIPLAFRTGASGKRTHIFWQRRIREGDATTPYWFPSKTDGGMMREDRLVLPIPPGTHWTDPMPVLLPTPSQKALPDEKSTRVKAVKIAVDQPTFAPRGIWFPSVAKPADRKKKEPRAKVKADPKHVAAARELRDRYLEQFNSGLVLPGGKYEVSRQIEAMPTAVKMIAA